MSSKLFLTALGGLLLLGGTLQHTTAYTFGMLSHDDTAASIQNIENQHRLTLPMISFIWDDYDSSIQTTISGLPRDLGTGRIYHITLSPREHTAQQVAEGYFDREYTLLFKNIKQSGIKVVFRTMHEMNGGWYPWSGSPYQFKKAWKRIHQLSREAGLNQHQILFDFSVNGRDMPTVGGEAPHQGAALVTCTPVKRRDTGCLTRENYYPGDEYVDLMGVTFYNRGKATSDRMRLTPSQIMDEPRYDIRNRLTTKQKPIIIDEVGTTSIWYESGYVRTKSLQYYQANKGEALKNQRLTQLATRAASKPELAALNYFNTDRTMGLARENPGEADRSVIDLDNDRYYESILDLYNASDDRLSQLFINPAAWKKQDLGDRGKTKKTTTPKPVATESSETNTPATYLRPRTKTDTTK